MQARLVIFVLLAFTLASGAVFAQTGVGVGLGKIHISEPLAPGGIYRLPDLPVVNTGEVAGTYTVRAVQAEGSALRSLGEGGFGFSPQTFNLEPGQSRLVKVSLTLPLTVPGGDYLFYLEASPVQNPEKGVAIGPAAATKVYFTVKSGTVLGAIRNRIVTFILTRPEIYLILSALFLLEALLIFRRNFVVSLRLKPRSRQSERKMRPQ